VASLGRSRYAQPNPAYWHGSGGVALAAGADGVVAVGFYQLFEHGCAGAQIAAALGLRHCAEAVPLADDRYLRHDIHPIANGRFDRIEMMVSGQQGTVWL